MKTGDVRPYTVGGGSEPLWSRAHFPSARRACCSPTRT